MQLFVENPRTRYSVAKLKNRLADRYSRLPQRVPSALENFENKYIAVAALHYNSIF